MKLKISNMTGKLKDIQAINTNTLSNDFCKKENQSNNPDKICTFVIQFICWKLLEKVVLMLGKIIVYFCQRLNLNGMTLLN